MKSAGVLGVALAAVMAFGAWSETQAQGATHEVTVTIKSYKALDSLDRLSKADVFARVTIGGKVLTSPVLNGKDGGKPNWVLKAEVPAGDTKVKVELLDKDAALDDPIDINVVANKRDLDFTVNTTSGKIAGFSSPYKVKQSITRAGKETKKASITFVVTAK